MHDVGLMRSGGREGREKAAADSKQKGTVGGGTDGGGNATVLHWRPRPATWRRRWICNTHNNPTLSNTQKEGPAQKTWLCH